MNAPVQPAQHTAAPTVQIQITGCGPSKRLRRPSVPRVVEKSSEAQNPMSGLPVKITMSGLLVLCGLALLAQHVVELGSNFTGNHLVAGLLMFVGAVIVWYLPSEPDKE